MSRLLVLGLSLGLAACGSADVFLPNPPGLLATDAVLLVIERPDGRLQVEAQPGDTKPLFDAALEADGEVRITALRYPGGLGALEVMAGPVPPVESTRCGARGFPPTASAFQVVLQDGVAGAWAPIAQLSAELAAFRFAGPCPCHTFETVPKGPVPGLPRAGLTTPDGGLLFVAGNGAFTLLHADGTLEGLTVMGEGPVRGVQGALLDDVGDVWIATSTTVWRGHPDRGFVRTATVSGVDELRAIDGGLGPDGFELYGTTQRGRVWQLAPGAPRLVSERAAGPAMANQEPNVVWRGPGRVVVSEAGALDLAIIERGALQDRALLPEESRGARLLELIPGIGVVAVGTLSDVFFLEGDELVQGSGVPELATPNALIAFRGGFLYGGDGGALQEFQSGLGFCPTQDLAGLPRIRRLYAFGERLVVFGTPVDRADDEIYFIDAAPLDSTR